MTQADGWQGRQHGGWWRREPPSCQHCSMYRFCTCLWHVAERCEGPSVSGPPAAPEWPQGTCKDLSGASLVVRDTCVLLPHPAQGRTDQGNKLSAIGMTMKSTHPACAYHSGIPAMRSMSHPTALPGPSVPYLEHARKVPSVHVSVLTPPGRASCCCLHLV